jgi:hypothetical protein
LFFRPTERFSGGVMGKVLADWSNEHVEWFDTPTGSPEEKEEAFEVASNYMYKLLDYADKDEVIPADVLERERRIFSFCKVGPRAAYLRLDATSKLVSADVLYMLTSTLPAEHIARRFNMSGRKVRAIRRGEAREWYWEYLLIRRLRVIIQARLKVAKKGTKAKMYSISKLVGIDKYEILHYASGRLKLVKLREDIIPPKEYEEMVSSKTLDILYPINQIDLL